MTITTENLIQNLPNNEFDENDYCQTRREVELMRELGCKNWSEVVVKYHTEVGYKPEGGVFNVEAVNEN